MENQSKRLKICCRRCLPENGSRLHLRQRKNSLHQKGNQHKKGRYQHQIKVTLSISISAMTDWVKALQKKNSRQILQQSRCWSRSRAKTVMLHRRNSRFYPSMSAGVVLPMRLTRANQTGQQNITS